MDVKRIYVTGLGCVSPAGWGVGCLRAALDRGEPLPSTPVGRPGWKEPLWLRAVPALRPAAAFAAHPRFRRASPITHYSAAVALEALATAGLSRPYPERLGLVMCVLSGCVQYTQRFLMEVLQDPASASPLLFPETVFNAPASHLAALLGAAPLSHTLLGDSATFVCGLGLAAEWLLEGRVEACLVIGAEEASWLLADALWHLERRVLLAAGAGAVLLSCQPTRTLEIELSQITDPQLFTARQNREQAVHRARSALPPGGTDELLCDGRIGRPRADAAETAAWSDWPGARLSPKVILGEGLMAAAAWQCVAACDALAQGRYQAATVSVVGQNQQAIGARFIRSQG